MSKEMKNFGIKHSIVISCITTCFLLGGFTSCVGAQGNCEYYRLIFMYAAMVATALYYCSCTSSAVVHGV